MLQPKEPSVVAKSVYREVETVPSFLATVERLVVADTVAPEPPLRVVLVAVVEV